MSFYGFADAEFDFMTGRSIVLDGGRALPRFPKLELEE